MSSISTNDTSLSHPSFVRSTEGQLSSIRFVDTVIGNLGENLRDGSWSGDEDTDMDEDDMALPCDSGPVFLPQMNEAEPAHIAVPNSDSISRENAAGSSSLPFMISETAVSRLCS